MVGRDFSLPGDDQAVHAVLLKVRLQGRGHDLAA